MHSIYIAALITTIFSIFIAGIISLKISKRELRYLLSLGLISLPESYIAFNFIRTPIDNLIKQFFNISPFLRQPPFWYFLIQLLNTPITEELMKLTSLVIPFFRRNITKDNRIAAGMILGLGFGIGEMWLIATWFSRDTSILNYHWYQLGGYIFERILSCFSHGVFTVIAIRGLGNKFIKYIIYAMGLHALSNLPIILFSAGFIRLDKIIFQHLMSIYLLVFMLGLGLILGKVIKK